MKAAVFTLGCKVNQYESRKLLLRLIELGFDASMGLVPADLFIVNTCSVTGEADKKSRQTIARILKLNPQAKIIIMGCSSENNDAPFKNHPSVIAVCGTKNKLEFLENTISSGVMTDIILNEVCNDTPMPDIVLGNKSRGLLKIQDGCDNFCTYCRVPYLRGRSVSLNEQDIISEFEKLKKDTKEIVITGVDVSSYGKDTGSDLATLLSLLKGNVRKRLSSLECGIIDRRLLETMRENGYCDHFHLSLQSGSDSVLKRMNRKYTAEEYYQRVLLIREYFPFAGITTDIIAGFSGETENEHNETLEFVKKVGFSDIHVFPFSKREGTRAYSLPDIDKQIKVARAAELTRVKNELKAAFIKKNLGRSMQVFVEDKMGFTSNYIKVYTNAVPHSMVTLRLIKPYRDGVLGEEEASE